jgi:hypothetical protein
LVACGARTGLEVWGSTSFQAGDNGGADATAQDSAPASDVIDAIAPPDPCAGMPPVPCSGGGFQYCMAGHYSDCPARCQLCVPGSTSVCFKTYCLFWGTETCTADGLSYGRCFEEAPPPRCASIATQYMDSPELEKCCIDSGYCCEDHFDLDGDGNANDFIGKCGKTSC